MAQIHPTAIVSAEATLAEDVQVGAYAVVDGPAILGRGCILRPFAHILGQVTLGDGNDVGSGCVLGERPQHRGYNGEPTGLIVGDNNVFREHVTVHRGMPNANVFTRIGSNNYFMASSHVAHDCLVGDNCTFANCALIAGHVTVQDGVLISGNSAVHQNVRLGRLALISGLAGVGLDVPPFWIMREINRAAGVNVIGMKRSGIPSLEIQAVRQCFKMIYHDRRTIRDAVAAMEERYPHLPAVREIVEFIRASKRGVPGAHRFLADTEAAAA